jgi:hypothetical protein
MLSSFFPFWFYVNIQILKHNALHQQQVQILDLHVPSLQQASDVDEVGTPGSLARLAPSHPGHPPQLSFLMWGSRSVELGSSKSCNKK